MNSLHRHQVHSLPSPTSPPTDLPSPSSLVGTGNVDRAAIFNSEGNSVWATSPAFTVSPQEMQEIVSAYKDPGKDGVKQVQSTGLHVAGERFVVLKADDRSIYGKKVSPEHIRDGPETGPERGRNADEMIGRIGVEDLGV